MLTTTFVILAILMLALRYRDRSYKESCESYLFVRYIAVIACAMAGLILSCS